MKLGALPLERLRKLVALLLIAPGVRQLHTLRLDELLLAVQLLGTRAGAKQRQLALFGLELAGEFGDLLLFIEIAQAGQNVAFHHAASLVNEQLDDDAFGFGPNGQLVARHNFEFGGDFQLPVAGNGNENRRHRNSRVSVFPDGDARGDRAQSRNRFQRRAPQSVGGKHRKPDQARKRESGRRPSIQGRVHVHQ